MIKILIVEDDSNVCNSLAEYLTREGFEVEMAFNLKDAKSKLLNPVDLLILDWMLPDGQGVDLLRTLRQNKNGVPTILLSARADLVDKVMGLELGANDYMTKPFEPRELLARARGLIRQGSSFPPMVSFEATNVLSGAGIQMNLSKREVSYKGLQVQLSKVEFDLLKLFLQNPNQVFARDELLNKVWGYNNYPSTRTVDTHILQLRQKFQEDLFETLRGVGYKFNAKN
jgi:DNA-binding response OmpR family regulator